MYHLSRPGGPVKKSLRPPLDLIERRRREQIEEPTVPWRSRRVARAGAIGVLSGCAICFAIALALVSDPSGPQTAAAEAAPAPMAMHRRADVRASAFEARHAAVAHRHAAAHAARTHERSARGLHAVRERLARSDPSTNSASPSPSVAPTPASQPSAQQSSASPLSARPWTLTADGTWSTIVTLRPPPGVDTHRLAIAWSSDVADVLPLDGNAQDAPGAIVTVGANGATASVVAAASDPSIGTQTLSLPPTQDASGGFNAVAQAVGPHLVDVGWTPLEDAAGVVEYKVYSRARGSKHGVLLGVVSPHGHSWQDAAVAPDTTYEYTVVASTGAGVLRASTGVQTPQALADSSLDAISGKGMFLYFTPNAADANAFAAYDPDAVVAKARAARISHIEVRLARGTFFEASTPAARAWLDALIDKATAAGIKLIAWQVPRRSSSADAATAVGAAAYETAAGNGFAGLALDIEDGDNYMGSGEIAKQRMVDQIEMVRKAVGPDYLLVATIMSPALTHWTNARYPFARIAPYASVLQPMEYWHHFYTASHHAYTQDEVASACADSVTLTQRVAGRAMPVNVAGQSDDLGTTGAPSPDEIGWCLAAARQAGAIGQTFFDWRGTGDDDWSAIAGFAW